MTIWVAERFDCLDNYISSNEEKGFGMRSERKRNLGKYGMLNFYIIVTPEAEAFDLWKSSKSSKK